MSDQPPPGRPGRRGWRGPLGWRRRPGQPDWHRFVIALGISALVVGLVLIVRWWL